MKRRRNRRPEWPLPQRADHTGNTRRVSRWSSAFSDWSYDIERMIESGDEVVIVRERGHGRGLGDEQFVDRIHKGSSLQRRRDYDPEARLPCAKSGIDEAR